ncbi:hypothetical protein Tco_1303720 [Tanacetum coccineum]
MKAGLSDAGRPVAVQSSTRNKKDERGVVVRNKARLVAQGHRQEEGIDYDESINMDVKRHTCMWALLKRSFFTVKQSQEGIFISQDKYVAEILKKFDFVSVKSAVTPMETKAPLAQDEGGPDVDLHLYRSMIGCLMYLTASRPDIMYGSLCLFAISSNPKGIPSLCSQEDFHVHQGKTKARLMVLLGVGKMLQAQLGHEKGHASCHLLIGWKLVQLKYCDKHNQVGFLYKPAESADYTEIVDFLRRSKLRSIECTITLRLLVRRQLQLADASGINMLQNEEIFAGLQNIGPLLPAMLTIDACQPQPSAAPTPSQPVPTPTPSHVQIPPITSTPPSNRKFKGITTPPVSKLYRRKPKSTATPTKVLDFEEPAERPVTTASTAVNTGSTPLAQDNTGSTPSAQDNTGSTPSTQVNTGSTPSAELNTGETERVQRREGKAPMTEKTSSPKSSIKEIKRARASSASIFRDSSKIASYNGC